MSGVVIYPPLLVGCGGFFDPVLRYALSGLVHRWVEFTTFPYGTMAVNVAGCLAIGLLAVWMGHRVTISR